MFWSVCPHSSHHDCCQKEDGGDASAAQSQWNQVSSITLLINSFFLLLIALSDKSIIISSKRCIHMYSITFLSPAWRLTQTQGQLTSVRQKTACISGWPCWPLFWADRFVCCDWEAAAPPAAAHAVLHQRFTSVDHHQVLKCLCCVLVTSIVLSFHCQFFHPGSCTVFYTATIKEIRLLVVSDLDMFQLL